MQDDEENGWSTAVGGSTPPGTSFFSPLCVTRFEGPVRQEFLENTKRPLFCAVTERDCIESDEISRSGETKLRKLKSSAGVSERASAVDELVECGFPRVSSFWEVHEGCG